MKRYETEYAEWLRVQILGRCTEYAMNRAAKDGYLEASKKGAYDRCDRLGGIKRAS